jgi:hypothetical protein
MKSQIRRLSLRLKIIFLLFLIIVTIILSLAKIDSLQPDTIRKAAVPDTLVEPDNV